MPPKKAPSNAQMEEDMEEIPDTRLDLRKRQRINELEKRIDDLEQYTRMEDVIITGLCITPRSYAKATIDGRNVAEDAGTKDLQSLEKQVLQFFHGKDIHLDEKTIAACHTLPRRDKTKPAIILRFANRKYKTELLRQGRKLKGCEVFVNEHLTKKTAEIAREARLLRRNNKIRATWTRNCKVYIQLNGSSPEQAKVLLVRDLRDLQQFK
ncbi:hypothetical protein WMY93_032517 [Mugilogobius chulae]|uniref:Uncharacterized protein n=1 Tax=Mugilogobius chulae TaxID=88201 RepID=A0AAW0MRN4_9GOBI